MLDLAKTVSPKMSTIRLDLKEDLASLLQSLNQPMEQAVVELIVLELYRRGALSSGKAAEMLDMTRFEFVRHASRLGIPFLDLSEQEWAAERARSEAL